MKKIKAFTLLLLLIFTMTAGIVTAAAAEPDISAGSALVIDMKTGEALYSHNEHVRIYPASITKIMTALVAIEAVNRGDVSLSDIVTAGEGIYDDLEFDASTQNILPGEQLSLEQLLYCAMVASANEACNVIADHVGGNHSTFIDMMNERAEQLGCKDTHFVNTHGLHNEGHYTTAHDMYIITKTALEYPFFKSLCNTLSYEIPATNMSDSRALYTTNNFITQHRTAKYYYEGAAGVKTGYTAAAGYCLVTTVSRDNYELITLVFGSGYTENEDESFDIHSFTDTKTLCDWVFDNYSYREVLGQGELICELPVYMGDETDTVILRPSGSISALLPNDYDLEQIERVIDLGEYSNGEPIPAPIEAGEVFGKISVIYNGRELGTLNLEAMRPVGRSSLEYLKARVDEILSMRWLKISIICIVLFIVIYIALVIRYNIVRKRRRKARNAAGSGRYRN